MLRSARRARLEARTYVKRTLRDGRVPRPPQGEETTENAPMLRSALFPPQGERGDDRHLRDSRPMLCTVSGVVTSGIGLMKEVIEELEIRRDKARVGGGAAR